MFVDRQNGVVTATYNVAQYEGQEELPDGHADLVAYQLVGLKRRRLVEVAAELARRNGVGFVYEGKAYQLDEASQGRIDALATKAERVVAGRPNATWDGRFIAADNTEVTFTAEAFGAFADAASNVVIARRFHARDLKNQILAATSAEDLEAIDVTTGWD